jgi:hypothetical protein
MRSSSLDVVRAARRTLTRLEPVAPLAFFLALLGAFGGLAAAAQGHSLILVLLAGAWLVVVVVWFAAWLLSTERRATKPPRHIPWRREEWRDFEHAFWTYVRRRSDAPPRR